MKLLRDKSDDLYEACLDAGRLRRHFPRAAIRITANSVARNHRRRQGRSPRRLRWGTLPCHFWFWWLPAFLGSWPRPSSLDRCPHTASSSLSVTSPPSLLRTLAMGSGPSWITPRHPISRPDTSSQVTFIGSRGEDADLALGGHFSTHYN